MTARRDARDLLLVALVALAVRVGFVLVQSSLHLFDVLFVAADSRLYLAMADGIRAGQGLLLHGRPTAYVGPVYPLFLAALRALGADANAIGLVQCAVGAATAGLTGMLAAELAEAAGLPSPRRRVALLVAGLAVALYPHLVFWTGYVLTETLFVLLVMVSVYVFVRAVRGGGTAYAAIAGSSAALAALTRPPYLAVALVLLAWWALVSRPRGGRAAVVLAVALGLPLAVWAARNAVELGAPVVTTTESGYVFYQGNSPGATGGTRGYVDDKDFVRLPIPPGLTEVDVDSMYLRAALASIRDDPVATVARWPAKIWNMWRPTYEGSSPRNSAITMLTYVPALLLGVAGAALLARGDARGAGAVPALFLLCWFAVHVAATGMIRFRLPAEAVLIVASPFALFALVDRVALRRRALPIQR